MCSSQRCFAALMAVAAAHNVAAAGRQQGATDASNRAGDSTGMAADMVRQPVMGLEERQMVLSSCSGARDVRVGFD